MTLLTKDEYKAIASGLDLPSMAFIDGSFRPALSGQTFATHNPANGALLGEVALCDEKDVDFAVLKAREAFEEGRWSRLAPGARKQVLIRLARLIHRNARELAVMESIDSGKPIYDCETVDLPEVIHCLTWHGEAIDKIYDQVAPASDDHIAMIIREPVGVVGLVLPWNFPLLMMAWKIAPALAAGCSVLLKPAMETSLTALRLAELAMEAGLPAGVLNVLPGGAKAGEAIGRHMGVDAVSFTGSTRTGKRFLTYAGESNAKEVTLEMGGKNPAVVMDDAENIDSVAQHIVNGAFWNMGENCSATSRLIVHEAVRDDLLARIAHHLQSWPMGDPLDPATKIGALVSPAHFDKVTGYLAQAENIVIGGRAEGGFVEPTVVALESNDPALAREEIFGPILGVITVSSFDEAISIANDTDYGLAASLFTGNAKRALRGARMLRAGTVTVNSFGEGDISTPFGGYGQSGFGGRDNGMQAHDQYTQIKTIWLDLSDESNEAVS